MADKATPSSRFQWEAGDFEISEPSNEAEKGPETSEKASAEPKAEPSASEPST